MTNPYEDRVEAKRERYLELADKPSAEPRQALKSNGFKWSPTRGAWVRMLNNRGRYCAYSALVAIGAAKWAENYEIEEV